VLPLRQCSMHDSLCHRFRTVESKAKQPAAIVAERIGASIQKPATS
jgi:hypothetical protein